MNDIWNCIKDTKDIEYLLNIYCNFHDTCICNLKYISGAEVDNEGAMQCGDSEDSKLNIIFQSQMVRKTLELQFIGLRRINLIGYQENYFCDIFSCYLSLYNGYIVWADTEYFNPESPCENKLLDESMTSFIVADGLKWRFIEKV